MFSWVRRRLDLAVAVGALCVAGCGSAPPPTLTATPRAGAADAPLRIEVASPAPTPAPVRVADPSALERALLAQRNADTGGPVAAHCRAPTAAERAHDPFGNARRLLSCDVRYEASDGTAVSGRYDVQVLANGCFVAEREKRRPQLGQVIYGCGVSR